MELIQVDKEVFFELVEETVQRIMSQQSIQEDKWITGDEAMSLMRIKSKSTLQKFRDEGRIRYTQPDRKYILYDRDSIMEFLENNAQEPFA